MTTIQPTAGRNYVDFDEYINFQLQKTRSSIKLTDILTALAGVLTLGLSYLFIFVVCDHWVVSGGFSTTARMVMLGFVTMTSLAWIGWKVVYPYWRNVNRLYAAREIENAHPELKNTLLNLVDARLAGKEVPEAILTTMEKRAAVQLSNVDVEQAIDRRQLLRLSYALLAVVVVCCLYTLFSPKAVSSSLWRALLPAAELGVDTRTEILTVQPGDVEILSRQKVEVTVDLSGEIPGEVTLYYTTLDQRFVNQPVPLRRDDPDSKQFRCLLTGENGKGILGDLTYYIVAGDATTADYSIRVIQPPTAKVEAVAFKFPDYMKRDPNPQTRPGGDIDAHEGTEVTVQVSVDQPVKGGLLHFTDSENRDDRAEEFPLRPVDGSQQQFTVTFPLEMRSDGSRPYFYYITCRNERGDSDSAPALYPITIHPDKAPEVAILGPSTDLERPANAIVPITLQAHDPDFQLRHVALKLFKQSNGAFEPIPGETLLDEERQKFETTYELKLESLNLKTGDVISFQIEARDNRRITVRGKGIPGNRTTVPAPPGIQIRIVDPVSEEQVRQQLNEDKKEQQDQLAEANQDQNNDNRPQNDQPEANPEQPQEPEPKENAQENKPEKNPEPKPGQQQEGKGNDGNPGQNQTPGQNNNNANSQNNNGNNANQSPLNDDGSDDQQVLDKLRQHQEQQKKNQNTNPQQPGPGSPENTPPGQQPSAENPPQENPGQQPQNQTPQQPNPQQQPGQQNQPGMNPEQQPGMNTESQPGMNPQPNPGENPQPNPEQKPEQNPGQNPQPGMNPEQNPQQQPGMNTEPQPGMNPAENPQKQPGMNPGENPQPNPEQKPEQQPGMNPGQNPKPEQQPGMNPEQQPGMNPEKQPGMNPAENPQQQPGMNPETKPEQQPGMNPQQQPGMNPMEQKPGMNDPETPPSNSTNNPAQPMPAENENPQPGQTPNSEQKNTNPNNPSKTEPGNPEEGTVEPDMNPQQPGMNPEQQPGMNPQQNPQQQPGQNPQQQPGQNPQQQPGMNPQQQPGQTPQQQPGMNPNQNPQQQPGQNPQQQPGQNPQQQPGMNPQQNPQQQPGMNPGQSPQNNPSQNPQQPQPGNNPGQPKPGMQQQNPNGPGTQNPDTANPGQQTPKNQNPQQQPESKPSTPQNNTNQPKANPNQQPPNPGNPEQKGPGRPNNQTSEQPDGGEPGSSTQSDQGVKGSNQEGPGDSSMKPGTMEQSPEPGPGNPENKPGMGTETKPTEQTEPGNQNPAQPNDPNSNPAQQPGNSPEQQPMPGEQKPGMENQPQQPGGNQQNQSPQNNNQQNNNQQNQSQQPGGNQQNQSQQPGGNQQSQQPGGNQQNQSSNPSPSPQNSAPGDSNPGNIPEGPQANNPLNGGKPGQGPLKPNENSNPTAAEGEAANLEFGKKATDLTLKKVREELDRGDVSPELLKELGWTEERLKQWTARMQQQLQNLENNPSPASDPEAKQFQEMLKQVGTKRSGEPLEERSTGGVGPRQLPVPREYQKAYDAFTRSLSKQK